MVLGQPGAASTSTLCVVAVALLLVAEHRGSRPARAVFKTSASLAFVATAWLLGAAGSEYGQFILAALALGLVGDVLLLSDRSQAFLLGLFAFLCSHAVFGAAFVSAGVAPVATTVAAVVALPVGLLIALWLWPHLGPAFRVAVVAYIVVILAMCSLAAGNAALHGAWWVLVGAVVFALSDIAVARDKFVAPALVNRLWGLPAYYGAQLLLAWSVRAAA